MIGQADLDAIVARATDQLKAARAMIGADMAVIPERAALVAIAEQLALANALAMIRLAREAGES